MTRRTVAPRRSLWRHLRAASWVIIGFTALTMMLERAGAFERFETTGIDVLNVAGRPPRDPSDIVIVGITDQDYHDLFNETSPLACATVRTIVEAIASGRPKVIAVDLDTSAKSFECLRDSHGDIPVVWAADALWDQQTNTFVETPVLGGAILSGGDSSGIAAMPQDSDGLVRRYHRELPIAGGGRRPSFAWAVVRAGCGAKCDACCQADSTQIPDDGLQLNFSGERFNFKPLSSSIVIDAAKASEKAGAASAWAANGLLTQKIVLLGGYYRQARDMQATAIGAISGAQITAQAIESELHGGGIRAVTRWIEVGFDLLIGYFLVFVNFKLHRHLAWALAVSLVLVPVVCATASFLTFAASTRWFNFVPVVVSVLVHQFYDHAREYQRLARAAGRD